MRLITLTAIDGNDATVTTSTVTLTTTDGSAKFSDSVEDFSTYVGQRVTFVDSSGDEATAYISSISGSDYLLVSEAYGSTRNMESIDAGFSSVDVASVVVDAIFMFDGITDSQTEEADAITETFAVAGFNALTILNCEGISATLDFTTSGDTITISLIRDSVIDWWDYFFAATRTGGDFVFYFPTQPAGETATLTIAYSGGTAKCGLCITGIYKSIATTRYGLSLGISDYSKISTNEFGQTYLNQGRWAKRISADGYVYNTVLDISFREVVINRGAACLFDYNRYTSAIMYDTPTYLDITLYAEEEYYDIEQPYSSVSLFQALVLYGFTEDFDITTPGPTISEIRHEAQGMT